MNIGDTLIQLLKIPSETGSEQKIKSYIKNYFSSFQKFFSLEIGNSLCYFSTATEKAKTTLAFYGHLDTVKNQQEWEVEQKGDYIYGCGASDMKGGLAIMMQLMNEIEIKENLPYNYQFIFYDGEEGDYKQSGLNSIFANKNAVSKKLKLPSLAFVLEPTDNQIQLGCVGSIVAKASFLGKSGHAARPWEGENAIHKAWKLLQFLAEKQPEKVSMAGVDFYEVLSATMVKGGELVNIIPDEIFFTLNYRYAPDKEPTQAEVSLKKCLKGKVDRFSITSHSPAGKVIEKNKILNSIKERFSLSIQSKQAWTDIARLGLEGIEALNLGPGDPQEAHQKNEKITVAALKRGLEVYQTLAFQSLY